MVYNLFMHCNLISVHVLESNIVLISPHGDFPFKENKFVQLEYLAYCGLSLYETELTEWSPLYRYIDVQTLTIHNLCTGINCNGNYLLIMIYQEFKWTTKICKCFL